MSLASIRPLNLLSITTSRIQNRPTLFQSQYQQFKFFSTNSSKTSSGESILPPQTYTLNSTYEFREEIKKSKFVTIAGPIKSYADAYEFLDVHSDLDATHNCWAYKLSGIGRCTDDGEPGGTAGQPMLAALDGQKYDNTVVLCIRYYGGTKLGAGGLVRAYGGGAAKCLREAEQNGYKIALIPTIHYQCVCDFSQQATIRQRILESDGAITSEEYKQDGSGIKLELSIPLLNQQLFLTSLQGGTSINLEEIIKES